MIKSFVLKFVLFCYCIGAAYFDDNGGWTVVQNELKSIEHVIKVPYFSYAWTQRFQSPIISSDDEISDVKWSFFVAPYIVNGNFNNYISLGLNITDFGNTSNVITSLTIELLNANNCSIVTQSIAVTRLQPAGVFANNSLYIAHSFSITATNYFPSNILTARFTAYYLINNQVITDGQYFIENIPECKKFNNINLGYRLLTDANSYPDIYFVVENRKIAAHKAIIRIKCPKLAQLFSNNTSDNVIINHADYDVFNELINFIYTDKIENLDTYAVKLLPLAYEYELKRLKALCEIDIASQITDNNVVEFYQMAIHYKAVQLEEYILRLVQRMGTRMSQESWLRIISKIK